MTTKINWVYDDHSTEYRAEHNGFRIRAVRDDYSENPFKAWDCNWPIVVCSGDRNRRGFIAYTAGNESNGMDCPIAALNDALLLHAQIMIATVFKSTVRDLIECYGQSDDELPEGKVLCRDTEVLREVFTLAWDDWSDSDKFDTAAELLTMAGVPVLSTTVTGYSQGDYADLLIIATPEAMEKFGRTEVTTEELQATADLYEAWAWGDVYGYIIEREVPGADPDEDPEWEEISDGACWGFYGSDFDKSGLEESALECIPEL